MSFPKLHDVVFILEKGVIMVIIIISMTTTAKTLLPLEMFRKIRFLKIYVILFNIEFCTKVTKNFNAYL